MAHTEEKPYKCNQCDKVLFLLNGTFNPHLMMYTLERNHIDALSVIKFGHIFDLELYLRIHTGEKSYKCTEIFQSNFIINEQFT